MPVQAIRKIEEARNGTIAEANKLKVESLADSDVANVILRKLTAGIRLVNERFKEILAPANETVRQVRDLRTQILKPLEAAKTDLTDRLMGWREDARRLAAEEQRKKDEEAAAEQARRRKIQEAHKEVGHQVNEPVVVEPEQVAPPLVEDTTKTRKKWDVKIIDKAKVPEKYKTVNEILLRKDMHTAARDEEDKPIFKVPGVEVVCEEVPVFG